MLQVKKLESRYAKNHLKPQSSFYTGKGINRHESRLIKTNLYFMKLEPDLRIEYGYSTFVEIVLNVEQKLTYIHKRQRLLDIVKRRRSVCYP